jgi:pimeloyl-ACP methyl ester carboxylesterase
MSDDTTKDTLSRYIAIAGVLLSTAALGVSVWTAASGELRQKQIDDIHIQQANDRAFDLLGGTHGAARDAICARLAVPMMRYAKMLHDGITCSQVVTVDGADHALTWTHSDELVRLTDEFLVA